MKNEKTFYCVSCKRKVVPQEVTLNITKNNRHQLIGKCPVCSTKTSRFVSKHDY